MLLNDPVYGSFDIGERVLLELIESAPIQRLKGVAQGGILEEVENCFSRYDHSIGVMLLLRKLGASVEEQVAGLIHDSSHTAFSHVADWVFGNPTKSDYQDAMLEQYIKGSVMGRIITRHGFDVNHVSAMESGTKYGLLERPAPDLCADRIDYTLRDGALSLMMDVRRYADALVVHDSEIIFGSREAARGFADLYVLCQSRIWMSNNNMLRYHLLAETLKSAMDKGLLTHDQMYGTDRDVVRILRASGDREVLKSLAKAAGPLNYVLAEDGDITLKGKVRYVDPKFMDNGRVERLSSKDKEYRRLLEDELKRMALPVRLRLL